MDAGSVIQIVATAITAVIGVVAIVISMSARNAANRQAVASEAAASAASEANVLARKALELAEAEAQSREAPRFEIAWNSGDTYVVRNVGDGPAFDVRIDHECWVENFGPNTKARMEPNEGLAVMIAPHMGMADDTVYVTWHRSPDGEPQAWSHPRPARPKR